jgi:hypothetical protein
MANYAFLEISTRANGFWVRLRLTAKPLSVKEQGI